MNIAQMQMMISLAECGSMTTTAKRLNVTQPALTYQLKSIESELGFKVFERGRTGTLLTREGAHLVEKLEYIVELFEDAVEQSRAIAGEPASILHRLADAVQRADSDGAHSLATTCREAGMGADSILRDGVYAGVKAATGQFAHGDIYTPEMLAVMTAANTCLAEIRAREDGDCDKPCRAAIGTMLKDSHTIGKDLVRLALESAQIRTEDLGRNCKAGDFGDYVLNNDACRLVLVSVSNPKALQQVRNVASSLEKAGVRDRVAFMVGGAAASPALADEIGADAFTADADDAVARARGFLDASP